MTQTDFLRTSLSKERWKTYETLSKKSNLSPSELYERNITYSKELYIILAGFEVVVRNAFHLKLKKHFKKDDWLSNFDRFQTTHQRQINNAIKKVSRKYKSNYTINDIIAELNFGFWAHLLDSPYEQKLWIPCLRHCFPHKFGKPVRQEIENKLKNILRLRNKIAHLEPIIKQEKQLLQAYQSAYDVISWICPDTADWFDNMSNFKNIWKDLQK